MAPIPPPQGLPPPKREIRALRRTAQFVAIGICAVIVVIVYWGLTHIGPRGSSSDASQTADSAVSGDSAAADVLRNAPTGTEIPARRKIVPVAARAPMQFNLNPQPQPTMPQAADMEPSSGSTPTAPADDDSEAAIAGRKAAWQTYYQALGEQQQQRLQARREAMAADIDAAPPTVPAAAMTTTATGGGTAEQQQQKPDFFASLASNPASDYSPYRVTNPISAYELKATDTITAKLVSSVNSDSPGIVKAIVTKTVTDHASGMHILIPQGSTLVGYYDTSVAYGQTRLVTAWTRIIYPPPCDQSLDLGAMPGADQSGQAGFEDITDNHLGKVFTAAILVSVFGAAAQLSQPQQSAFSTYSPVQTAAGAVGQQTTTLGAEFARRGLSIPPTEVVRQGYPFTVMITKDIAFEKPWLDGVCEAIEANAT